MGRCTLSIIVPVYNVASYLTRCLESILKQSYVDFEVILVDDGSTDNSLLICNDFAVKDSRIKVFHKENGGVSSARNYGIEKSTGDYLMFVDSDDWIQDNLLLDLSSCLGRFDMIFWGINFVTQNGVLEYSRIPHNLSSDKFSIAEIIYSLFSDNLLGYMATIVVRKTVLENYNIRFNTLISLHEDAIFCYECCTHATSVVSLDVSGYNYVQYDNENRKTLSSSYPDNYDDVLKIKEEFLSRMCKALNMRDEQVFDMLNGLKYQYCVWFIENIYTNNKPIYLIKDFLDEINAFPLKPRTKKEYIWKWIFKIRNPYLVYYIKKLSSFFK